MTCPATDFAGKWGRVKRGCKGLSRCTTALSKRFEDRLTGILGDLEACLEEAEEKNRKKVLPSLRAFIAMVRADLENTKAARRLSKHLKEAEKEFQRLRSELRDYDARAYEACSRYFERRQEYVRAREKTRERVRRYLEEIKKDFLERAEEVAKGYEIIYSEASTPPESLFESLVEGEEGRIELLPLKRELLGGSREETLARRAVMDYLIKETREKLLPVLRDRDEGLREVEALFPELRALEKSCREAEELRERAMEPLEELRREIINIRKTGVYTYSTEEKLKELRNSYEKKIGEVEEALK
jgi:superfamily II RNA helicase